MTKVKHKRGFVALMSVMIISAVLLTMVFTLGVSSFFSRFSVFDQENKFASRMLAESCIGTAMLRILQDEAYTGDELVVVNANNPQAVCRICAITTDSGIIVARATYNGAYTNLRVVGSVGPNNFMVTTWEEIPTYSGTTCTIG